jgi:hypothetical protein
MLYLVFLGGVTFGSIVTRIIFRHYTSYGELKIDPINDTCQVCLNTEQTIKTRTKRVMLTIDHHADLSQK